MFTYRMRLGFVTAPLPLFQKLVYHQQVTSMHASSLSQVKRTLSLKKELKETLFISSYLDACIETIRKMEFIRIQ